MSVLCYNVCMMNALLRRENEIQRKIIKNLKYQQTSKSEFTGLYYEKEITNLTRQLDDLYLMLESKK